MSEPPDENRQSTQQLIESFRALRERLQKLINTSDSDSSGKQAPEPQLEEQPDQSS